jgi:hypothetical protein
VEPALVAHRHRHRRAGRGFSARFILRSSFFQISRESEA